MLIRFPSGIAYWRLKTVTTGVQWGFSCGAWKGYVNNIPTMQFWLELLAQLSTVRTVVSISNWLAVLTPLSADISVKTSQCESTIRDASLTDYARETLEHCIGKTVLNQFTVTPKRTNDTRRWIQITKIILLCYKYELCPSNIFLDTRLEPHLELIVGDVQVFEEFELTHTWWYFFQQVSFHVDTHLSVCDTEREWLKALRITHLFLSGCF